MTRTCRCRFFYEQPRQKRYFWPPVRREPDEIHFSATASSYAFVFSFSPPASAGAQDDDHGKHKGWYKHGDGDDDDGYRHDNGKHKGWYKHHDRDDYDGWDYDGERIRPGHYYPHGRYPYIRHVIVVRGFDPRTRHIILYDQSNWIVAPYDVPRCRNWEWDRDRVDVYDDDRHPGWYVLFNSRLGRSIHVEFFGM